MRQGTLKQILLITDGCSNKGEDPKAVASFVYEQGITVNVIGVLNDQQGEEGLREVEEIAASGGGVSQIVYKENLSKTVQMVTRQAMTQTLQGVVNKQLQQILGESQTMEDIEPQKRGEMMEVVEDMGEQCLLEVLVLVDTSASMHNKLATVKEALLDLSISLNARIGKNLFSIFTFPGKRKEIDQVLEWSPELESISTIFPKLTSGGITPTGPALRESLYHFGKTSLMRSFIDETASETEEFL